MHRFSYSEPYLLERIKLAREEARRIINESPKTEEELFSHYVVLLSNHYKIPFFDSRWDTYTLDEIALEWFIVEEANKPQDTRTSEVLATNYKDDLGAMADEMEQWSKPTTLKIDEKDIKTMTDFMESGKFPGEK